MNTCKFLALVFICVFFTGCASNQIKEENSRQPFSAQGWGGTTCNTLLHDITPKNVGFEQAVQNIHLYQSWVSGFFSGVNYATVDAYDVSGSTSPEESFAWVQKYCTEHPNAAVPIVLHELLEMWKQEGKIIIKAQN